MTYKTKRVQVDDTPHAANRIRVATELALANGAHLIGSALTDISPFIWAGFTLQARYCHLVVAGQSFPGSGAAGKAGADGFSCGEQIAQCGGRQSLHQIQDAHEP